jgi:hypothetical protein
MRVIKSDIDAYLFFSHSQLVMSSSQEGMLRRVNPEATQKSKL